MPGLAVRCLNRAVQCSEFWPALQCSPLVSYSGDYTISKADLLKLDRVENAYIVSSV